MTFSSDVTSQNENWFIYDEVSRPWDASGFNVEGNEQYGTSVVSVTRSITGVAHAYSSPPDPNDPLGPWGAQVDLVCGISIDFEILED